MTVRRKHDAGSLPEVDAKPRAVLVEANISPRSQYDSIPSLPLVHH